jgi:hypothetical protein
MLLEEIGRLPGSWELELGVLGMLCCFLLFLAVSCSVFWVFGFRWRYLRSQHLLFDFLRVFCFFVLVALAVFVGCWGRST